MSTVDLNGLNAGYVAQMLEAYLDAPASVPDEWRVLFETQSAAVSASLPGLAGFLPQRAPNGADAVPVPEDVAPAPQAPPRSPPAPPVPRLRPHLRHRSPLRLHRHVR